MWKKTKVMRISRQPSPIQIMVDQKQQENVDCFSCVGSLVTNDARCTWEIKFRVAMAIAAFNKKNTPTHSIRQFPLHFPSRASPCAITFQLDSTSLTASSGMTHAVSRWHALNRIRLAD